MVRQKQNCRVQMVNEKWGMTLLRGLVVKERRYNERDLFIFNMDELKPVQRERLERQDMEGHEAEWR